MRAFRTMILTMLLAAVVQVAHAKCGAPSFWLKVMRDGSMIQYTEFNWLGNVAVYDSVYEVSIRPGDVVVARYVFSSAMGGTCGGSVVWSSVDEEDLYTTIQSAGALTSEIQLDEPGRYYVIGWGYVVMGFHFRIVTGPPEPNVQALGFAEILDPASPDPAFTPALQLTTNPVDATITVRYAVPDGAVAQWHIITATGAQVQQGLVLIDPGRSELALPAAELPSGIYVLQFAAGEMTLSQRFVKL